MGYLDILRRICWSYCQRNWFYLVDSRVGTFLWYFKHNIRQDNVEHIIVLKDLHIGQVFMDISVRICYLMGRHKCPGTQGISKHTISRNHQQMYH